MAVSESLRHGFAKPYMLLALPALDVACIYYLLVQIWNFPQ